MSALNDRDVLVIRGGSRIPRVRRAPTVRRGKGGRGMGHQHTDFAKFSEKLHEIEKISDDVVNTRCAY